jgi:epoxide hydrolase-like predicted phosphatase
MIQAIIFDVGGVLIRTQDWNGRRQWEQKLGLKEYEASEIFFSSDMGIKAQLGLVTEAELWAWVGEHLGLPADELQAFRRDFWRGDVLDEELVQLIRRLHGRYQTAIISNANDRLRHVLQKMGIADAFDLIVVSAEEQMMKPDPALYQTALERLGRQPAEAVFIDDFAHNIAAAHSLGMHTIHFKPDTDVEAELAKLGIGGTEK